MILAVQTESGTTVFLSSLAGREATHLGHLFIYLLWSRTQSTHIHRKLDIRNSSIKHKIRTEIRRNKKLPALSSPLNDSYFAKAAREAGSVAELADDRKSAKYTDLDTRYSFQPVAIDTLGPINDTAREFLFNLGRKISLQSGNDRAGSFLFQRISVLVQRFNAILLHNSFAYRPFQILCIAVT